MTVSIRFTLPDGDKSSPEVIPKGKRNVNNGIATLNQYAGVESDKRTAKMVNGVLVIQ